MVSNGCFENITGLLYPGSVVKSTFSLWIIDPVKNNVVLSVTAYQVTAMEGNVRRGCGGKNHSIFLKYGCKGTFVSIHFGFFHNKGLDYWEFLKKSSEIMKLPAELCTFKQSIFGNVLGLTYSLVNIWEPA